MAAEDEMDSRTGLSQLNILWITQVAQENNEVGFGLKFSNDVLHGFDGRSNDYPLSPGVGWTWKEVRREKTEDTNSKTIYLLQEIGLEEGFSCLLIEEIGGEEGEICPLRHLHQKFLPKAQIVFSNPHGIVPHEIETINDQIGLLGHSIQFVFWYGIRKFFEKEITYI